MHQTTCKSLRLREKLFTQSSLRTRQLLQTHVYTQQPLIQQLPPAYLLYPLTYQLPRQEVFTKESRQCIIMPKMQTPRACCLVKTVTQLNCLSTTVTWALQRLNIGGAVFKTPCKYFGYRPRSWTLQAFYTHILLHVQSILHRISYAQQVFYMIYIGRYGIVIRFIFHMECFTPTRYTRTSHNLTTTEFGLGRSLLRSDLCLGFRHRYFKAGICWHSIHVRKTLSDVEPNPTTRSHDVLLILRILIRWSLWDLRHLLVCHLRTSRPVLITFQSLSIFASLCHAKHCSRSPLHLAWWPSSPSAQRNTKDFTKTADTTWDNSFDRQIQAASCCCYMLSFERDKSR